jgi:diguanylate cyclase
MEPTTSRLAAVLRDSRTDAAAELARMQRSLLKLAFALSGRSAELDRVLAKLTNALRSGERNVNVTAIVDEIISAIGQEDLSVTRKNASLITARSVAAQFIDALAAAVEPPVPEEIANGKTRLEHVENDRALLALTSTLAQALAGSLVQVHKEAATDGSGLTLLLQTLNQLHFPESLTGGACALRTRLAEPPRPTDAEATRAVAELITAAQLEAQQESDRLSAFLRQVAVKIAHLQQQLHYVNESRCASIRESEAMSENVVGYVNDMRSSVEVVDDIHALKASIAGNLESLHKGVDEFMTSARERSEQTEELLTLLNGQLQTLEGETKKLREGIEQERERASTDALTGVANRLGFEAFHAHEFARWQRYGGDLSIIIGDIDHFKLINDEHGHLAGDKVLKTVADQLRSQLRESDLMARYGGEEFVVLLPNTSLEQANAVAEKLRRHLECCRFHSREKIVPVTLSAGVATYRTGDGKDAALERADRALYLAKRMGRNRIASEGDLQQRDHTVAG